MEVSRVQHFAAKAVKNTAAYLRRQLNDPFNAMAREHNYRARSAFKLLEMNAKHNFLKPGQVVLDVGAAPGSWSQVALEKVGQQGRVVAVDIQPMVPIPGVFIVDEGDIREESTQQKVHKFLEGRAVDCVLSDMAPQPTGDSATDHLRLLALCRSLVHLLVGRDAEPTINLSCSGILLCKIWDGSERIQFTRHLESFFRSVRCLRPAASRESSAEMYILARNPIIDHRLSPK